MTAALVPAATALLAQSTGRGETASDAGGVLIVVGIALLALLVAAAVLYALTRRARSRRAAEPSTEGDERPLPSEQGRPWSSERGSER